MRDLSDLLTGNENDDIVIAHCDGRPITLAQFRRDIAGNAARLAQTNCRAGLLVTADTYWCAVGMVALFQIGAEVILPQNMTPGAIDAIRDQWDLLVTDQPSKDDAHSLQLHSFQQAGFQLREIDAAACRLSLFTSGSTGHPKRVRKTLGAMQREAAAIEEIFGSTVPPKGRIVGTVTHQHLFGLSFKMMWPLCSGRVFDGCVYEFWEELLAQDLGGAVIVTSPAHLKRLGGLAIDAGMPKPACLLSAGAMLPDDIVDAAQKALGARLGEIYGSTETGTIGWRWRDTANPDWRAVPGVVLGDGRDGALRLRSPFLPDDDWHDGQDLIEKTESGFRLRGRVDRIVKIEGKRVSLPEVEAALVNSPLVTVASLLTLPDDGDVLAAVIVPSVDGKAELERLGDFRLGRLLRQSLAGHFEAAAMPRRWRFVDGLPTDGLGKVRQADLRALFAVEKREPELRGMRRHGQVLELDLFNAPDLVQLEGHFPAMAIVPGVAQVDWAVKFAARHMGVEIDSAQNYQVKFHRLTLPGTMVTLTLSHDAERQRLLFSYRRADDVLTSGTIRLAQQ